jgi:glycosyltransferase involved in cell wall biosynthesis
VDNKFDIHLFNENGFIVLDGVMSASEVHQSKIIIDMLAESEISDGVSHQYGDSEFLQRIWNLLNKDHLNLKLMLCGPIDERDPIEEDLYRRIISDKSIILVGEIHNPELYYSIFSCFVLPSYREGFPTVVLEASSMQLPIITTRSTGCIDSIIDNETGIYADISPISISEKISFYINNPLIAKQHGVNGRHFVINNFNQKLIWTNLHNIYFNA